MECIIEKIISNILNSMHNFIHWGFKDVKYGMILQAHKSVILYYSMYILNNTTILNYNNKINWNIALYIFATYYKYFNIGNYDDKIVQNNKYNLVLISNKSFNRIWVN